MSRAYSRNDIEIDRYDDRRSHVSRDGGRSRYDDRFEEEIDYRRGSGPLPSRRESVIIKEREEVTRTPAFLREDYGRTTAGPVVLRAREREDFEFAPRPRRRSPSPEVKKEREEIIIRRDQREERPEPPPPRPREVSREREEIIIRRDERSRSRGPARFRDEDTQREEIIIRRDERESTAPPRRVPTRDFSEDREEIIIRREEKEGRARFQDDDTRSMRSYRPPPSRAANTEREEIIIRREEREREDDSRSRVSNRYHEDDLALTRPISRERARGRSDSSESRDEIIIRRDERQGRGGNQERQEIIIRRSSRSRSRSPSPAASVRTAPMPAPVPAPEPQIVYAPQIHQEVITHHRHIDHGYEVQLPPHRPREPYREPVIARAPSPPSPPPPPAPEPVREREEERIEISRTNTRNGRSEREDIIIDRTEGARSVPPPARDRYEEREITRERSRGGWEERNIQEEAEYYNERANARGHIGEAYRGATKDWELVDVPPGTRRVRMDGVGGGQQEITWQRYNGARRAKFHPDGEGDEGYSSDYGRPAPRPIEEPAPSPQGTIGPRWAKQRDPTDGLWTEVTKDLVVKEAIIQMGYEYDETDEYYYVFKHLRYADMARLVGLSEEIRKERHKRIKEIQWENAVAPRPAIEPTPPRLAIEGPPSRDRGGWDRDEERYVEREIVYRGGRPPPPVGWRR